MPFGFLREGQSKASQGWRGREKELGKSTGQEEGAPQRQMKFLGLEVGNKNN